MESAKNVKNKNLGVKKSNRCYDCGKKIKDSVLLEYKNGNEKIEILKCDKCFKKNKSLSNFQKCEVYSRVVGYLRPVQQWNEGKQEEFEKRKNFAI